MDCGHGVHDPIRGVCECPMLFTGHHCETPVLPACLLGTYAIPIRSWVLHSFHDGAGRNRWRDVGEPHPIGPVPCKCLRQFVSAPFFLERTRLKYMRGFVARCVDLPSNVTLEQFIEAPDAPDRRRLWRRFSFSAAHDALRLGSEPALYGAPLDPEQPQLGPMVDAILQAHAGGRKDEYERLCPRGLCVGEYLQNAPYNLNILKSSIPPLLLPLHARALPLAPLSACSGGCGRMGWCEYRTDEPGATKLRQLKRANAGGRCGCFVPTGLDSPTAGGSDCSDTTPWRPDRQPSVHWGPSCLLNCSNRGQCDWHGFCKCDAGYWGIDCGLTRLPSGKPIVDAPLIEQLPIERHPKPRTPMNKLLADGMRRHLGSINPSNNRRSSKMNGMRNRIYVADTPPLLRFGVDFAAHVEQSLTERMLRSVHRTATVQSAEVIWYPGAPLVIDGHRLLARLWHAVSHWLDGGSKILEGGSSSKGQSSGKAKRLPLVLMPLLTERASMDSFQLSYAEDDREEWPSLIHSAHVQGILKYSNGACGDPKAFKAGSSAARGPTAATRAADATSTSVGSMLRRRKARLGRNTLLGLFEGGGYMPFRQAAFRSGCALPPKLLPWSTDRIWGGLQFSGNPRDPVFFQRRKDVVIPQMLLLAGGGSHADQPSCEQMASSSPLSSRFSRHELHTNRSTLLWFGGHGGHGDARTAMFRLHSERKGFVLVDTLHKRPGMIRRDAINMSLSSVFCWVPRGQGQGDPTRHMVALFHGCLPVFTLGQADDDDALPFDEYLPWGQFSLRVPIDSLRSLPSIVRAAARDGAALKAMQSKLNCVWRSLFWTSLKGSCFGEGVRGDAFDALMRVLALRSERRRAAGAKEKVEAKFCEDELPSHLLDRDRLAPGSTWSS